MKSAALFMMMISSQSFDILEATRSYKRWTFTSTVDAEWIAQTTASWTI